MRTIISALLYWPNLWIYWRKHCQLVKLQARKINLQGQLRTKKLRWAGNYLTDKYVEENAMSFREFVRKARHG